MTSTRLRSSMRVRPNIQGITSQEAEMTCRNKHLIIWKRQLGIFLFVSKRSYDLQGSNHVHSPNSFADPAAILPQNRSGIKETVQSSAQISMRSHAIAMLRPPVQGSTQLLDFAESCQIYKLLVQSAALTSTSNYHLIMPLPEHATAPLGGPAAIGCAAGRCQKRLNKKNALKSTESAGFQAL